MEEGRGFKRLYLYLQDERWRFDGARVSVHRLVYAYTPALIFLSGLNPFGFRS